MIKGKERKDTYYPNLEKHKMYEKKYNNYKKMYENIKNITRGE